METYVDMVGAFTVFALHWSVVEWANGAGFDETVDLSSFRLGPFFLRWSGMIDPSIFRSRPGPGTLSSFHVSLLAVGWWL